MEDASLSALLEDLIRNEQIDWLTSSLPLNLGTELYINGENSSSSSPTMLEMSQLPDDEHKAGDNSSPTNSQEEFVNNEDMFDNTNNKRKRRENQTQSEAKRRMKFNEQMATLRALFCGEDANSKKNKNATREAVLNSAIREILQLRQEVSLLRDTDSPLKKLGTGRFPLIKDIAQRSLSDPHNRSPYSMQDLERAFQTMLAREVAQFCKVTNSRTEQTIYHSIKTLKDVSKQLGKPEYQLSVGILEQGYHHLLCFNPIQMRAILHENWNLYQSIRNTDQNTLLLFSEREVGTWILINMATFEYMSGNMEAAERTSGYAKKLSRKIQHPETSRFLLAKTASHLQGSVTVPTALKINSILQNDFSWEPLGYGILGSALIANGQVKEGIDTMESSINLLMDRKGDTGLSLTPPLLEAYMQTGNIDKGLSLTNYILKHSGFSMDGCLGKAEVLRLRANLVLMKKYPNYMPFMVSTDIVDSSVEDVIDLCENVPKQPIQIAKKMFGPAASTRLQACLAVPPDANDDAEMILRSAMNLAQIKELYTLELRCAVDLARYFLHIGDLMQAMETTNVVKNCMTRMKGPENSAELQRARSVIALVENSVQCSLYQ